MAGSSIAHRRKIRALEAKRDQLIEKKGQAAVDLARVRAELKSVRRSTAR